VRVLIANSPIYLKSEHVGGGNVQAILNNMRQAINAGLCGSWTQFTDSERKHDEAPSGTVRADIVLRVHATTQLHNVPAILREIAAQVERKGCTWSKANGSGTSWDWEVGEQDNAPRDLRGDSRVTVHADVVPGGDNS